MNPQLQHGIILIRFFPLRLKGFLKMNLRINFQHGSLSSSVDLLPSETKENEKNKTKQKNPDRLKSLEMVVRTYNK